jgi:nitroimidazol reductase NimA-like FMN-containing flavoprotein (pyridoxamine 5'-phosphate oxidase superfamily)
MDYLAANPIVWGQITEDRGYLDGRCDHAYRSVQFRGHVEFLDDLEAKRRALNLMIEQLESQPDPVETRILRTGRLEAVAVGCIWIEEMASKGQ